MKPMANLKDNYLWPAGDCEEGQHFVSAFRELAKNYTMRDLFEEFLICGVFPVHAGLHVTTWVSQGKPLSVPDFGKNFSVKEEDLDPQRAEARVDKILGPVTKTEHADAMKILGPVRRNRVSD